MDKVICANGYKTHSMKFKSVLVGMFSVLCLAYGQATASEEAAYWPPASETFTDNNISINHVGSAMRYRDNHPIYIASLYTQDSFPNTAVLLSNDGSKELQLIIMDDSLSHRRFQRLLRNDLIITLNDDEYTKLQPEINALLASLKGKYHVGTLVSLNYDSLRNATIIKIDEERKTTINGKNIFNAMLKAMAGDRPPSRDFKDALLGFKTPVINMTEEQEVLLTQYMSNKLDGSTLIERNQHELAINNSVELAY
ncbi:chalcone isomerase family protein [Litoribrevibacter albus]|uniref:Chalcone isomerase domain-containing protein n=1 Tax=Litoribrevibacter albus TaxID=1473156 RepID=A0AA37S9X9_9GAMM|nr:chalcone isomerase family protein [Litoribrevibacter albus]GLQ31119.1 hypothetical protein GCM10007876_15980 [Litoribrevibacter albus]